MLLLLFSLRAAISGRLSQQNKALSSMESRHSIIQHVHEAELCLPARQTWSRFDFRLEVGLPLTFGIACRTYAVPLHPVVAWIFGLAGHVGRASFAASCTWTEDVSLASFHAAMVIVVGVVARHGFDSRD